MATISTATENVTKPKASPKTKYSKLKFTPYDDMRLRELINPMGYNNWYEIAKKMKNRNPRQCKDRWEYYLSPMVNNGPWTPQEDQILLEKYQEYGTKWIKIARFLRGRTNTCCKNRFLWLKRMSEKNQNIEQQRNHLDSIMMEDSKTPSSDPICANGDTLFALDTDLFSAFSGINDETLTPDFTEGF